MHSRIVVIWVCSLDLINKLCTDGWKKCRWRRCSSIWLKKMVLASHSKNTCPNLNDISFLNFPSLCRICPRPKSSTILCLRKTYIPTSNEMYASTTSTSISINRSSVVGIRTIIFRMILLQPSLNLNITLDYFLFTTFPALLSYEIAWFNTVMIWCAPQCKRAPSNTDVLERFRFSPPLIPDAVLYTFTVFASSGVRKDSCNWFSSGFEAFPPFDPSEETIYRLHCAPIRNVRVSFLFGRYRAGPHISAEKSDWYVS